MLPSMSSIIPKAARQKALDVFYAQYLRIFQPILESQPEIAHEHAIK